MIKLHLPFPVSVNAAYANGGNGRGRHKTAAYRDWFARASAQVKDAHRAAYGRYCLDIKFMRPDGRRRDIGNLEKVVSDFLVEHGVVKDDSLAEKITLEWAEDLAAPCVVTVEPLDEWVPVGQAASSVIADLARRMGK